VGVGAQACAFAGNGEDSFHGYSLLIAKWFLPTNDVR